jgi:hypothetical protein
MHVPLTHTKVFHKHIVGRITRSEKHLIRTIVSGSTR